MRVRVWLPFRLARLKGDERGIGGRDSRREVHRGQTAALQFYELDRYARIYGRWRTKDLKSCLACQLLDRWAILFDGDELHVFMWLTRTAHVTTYDE